MKNANKKKEIGGFQFHMDAVCRLLEKHFKVIRNNDDPKEATYLLEALVRAVAVTGGVQDLSDEAWDNTVEWVTLRLKQARKIAKKHSQEGSR